MEEDSEEIPLQNRTRQRRRASRKPPANYDDVFGGPPKHQQVANGAAVDYNEVFCGVAASCSIPYLDLKLAGEETGGEGTREVDYGEVFGRYEFEDYAVPYEELFGMRSVAQGAASSNGRSSFQNRSGPQLTDSKSEFIQQNDNNNNDDIPYLPAVHYSHRPLDSDEISEEYNASYSKSNQIPTENTKLVSQPKTGFSFLVESDLLSSNPKPGRTEIISEKINSNNNGNHSNGNPKPRSSSSRSVSSEETLTLNHNSNIPFLNIDKDVNFEPKPAPLSPAPKFLLKDKQKTKMAPKFDSTSNSQQNKPFMKSESLPSNFDFSFVPEPVQEAVPVPKPRLKSRMFLKSDSLPPNFEMDASSASQAMKEAMQFAQARLKTAKEMMDKKREGKITEMPLKRRVVKEEVSLKQMAVSERHFEGIFAEIPLKKKSVSEGCSEGRITEIPLGKKTVERESFERKSSGSEECSEGKITEIPLRKKSGKEEMKLEKSGKWKSDEEFYELTSIMAKTGRESKVEKPVLGFPDLEGKNRKKWEVNPEIRILEKVEEKKGETREREFDGDVLSDERERQEREREEERIERVERERERERVERERERERVEQEREREEERERVRKLEEEKERQRMRVLKEEREKERMRVLEEEREKERMLVLEEEREKERMRVLEEESERQKMRELEEEREREKKLEEEKEREREKRLKEEKERVRELEEERENTRKLEEERERVAMMEKEKEQEKERENELEEEREKERRERQEKERLLEEEREREKKDKEKQRILDEEREANQRELENERLRKLEEAKEREKQEREMAGKLEEERERMRKSEEERQRLRKLEEERERMRKLEEERERLRKLKEERELEREKLRKMEEQRDRERKLKEKEQEEEREREAREKLSKLEIEKKRIEKEKSEERERDKSSKPRKSDEERESERRREKAAEREREERERARRLEEEREREREREKDRLLAVERATQERAERIAIERITAARQRAAFNESREKDEIRTSNNGSNMGDKEERRREARIRADQRAAVDRAMAEARERGIQKLKSFKDLNKTTNQVQESAQDANFKRTKSESSLGNNQVKVGEDESSLRHKARLERQQRTAERAAKALAEKNRRDILAQREKAERDRIAEHLDAEVKRWSNGKEGNLRALLSTLQYVLGHDSGWQPIPLTEVITAINVKKAYRKATLYVHPDKLQQRGASIHQKYICEKVFDLLKEAWNKFNSEER